MDAGVDERMVLGKKEGLERSICHGWQGCWVQKVGGEKEEREGDDDKGVAGVS